MVTKTDRKAIDLIEALMESVQELIDKSQDTAQELRELGDAYEYAIDGISRGLVSDLEMRMDDNHSWLGKSRPTLRDLIQNIEELEEDE